MFDKKYLMNFEEKEAISGGFIFWNFAITLSMICSSIVGIVNAGLNTATAVNQINNPQQVENNKYFARFNSAQPYFRLSKYPSKSMIGFPTF